MLVGHKHISSERFQVGEELQGIPGGIFIGSTDKRLIVLLASLYCVVVAGRCLDLQTGLFSSGWISANGGSGHAQAVTEFALSYR